MLIKFFEMMLTPDLGPPNDFTSPGKTYKTKPLPAYYIEEYLFITTMWAALGGFTLQIYRTGVIESYYTCSYP